MPYYRRRPLNEDALNDLKDLPGTLVQEATGAVRRLLPFPGASGLRLGDAEETLSQIAELGGVIAATNALPISISEQAGALVPRAASILDEDMARGVLAARAAPPMSRSASGPGALSSAPGTHLLEDMHAFIDRFAQFMPMGRDEASAASYDGLPVLRGKAVVSRGQQAVLSMQLDNAETQTVRLIPSVTDLLGNKGGRIAARCIEFSARDVQLLPGQRQTLSVTVTVPTDCAQGLYSGLLVMAGLSDLRALICLDVNAA